MGGIILRIEKNIDLPKGQLISKKIVKPRILPKNERMNSFLLKWEAEDIVSKIRVSLEVNTKYFLI